MMNFVVMKSSTKKTKVQLPVCVK